MTPCRSRRPGVRFRSTDRWSRFRTRSPSHGRPDPQGRLARRRARSSAATCSRRDAGHRVNGYPFVRRPRSPARSSSNRSGGRRDSDRVRTPRQQSQSAPVSGWRGNVGRRIGRSILLRVDRDNATRGARRAEFRCAGQADDTRRRHRLVTVPEGPPGQLAPPGASGLSVFGRSIHAEAAHPWSESCWNWPRVSASRSRTCFASPTPSSTRRNRDVPALPQSSYPCAPRDGLSGASAANCAPWPARPTPSS